jgi:type I restriction enzyme S subunit
MELRPGYRQTEVGVIPQMWEARFLRDVCWFQEGPGLRNWQFTTSGMKVINVTNLEGGVLNLDRTDRHISMALFRRMYQHFAVDDGDIVMASSGNSYSKTAVVRKQDLPLVMNTSVIRFKPGKSTEYGFLLSLLTSWIFKDQIDLMITGGAQPNFGPYHLKKVIVPFPPLPEQRAIARALVDVDELLDALSQLIAKKRNLKQAAMQELLRPKVGWVAKTLGESCEIVTKGTTPTSIGQDFTSSGINFLKAESISEGGQPIPRKMAFIDEFTHRLLKRSQLRAGDILISIAGVLGRVGLVERDTLPANTNQALAIIRLGKEPEFERDYLFYYLRSSMIERQISDINVQAAQANISLQNVREFQINIPLLRSDQTAIAGVLSDMDAELSALEQRLGKTRTLKQGMMQELLTGRTRLV